MYLHVHTRVCIIALIGLLSVREAFIVEDAPVDKLSTVWDPPLGVDPRNCNVSSFCLCKSIGQIRSEVSVCVLPSV